MEALIAIDLFAFLTTEPNGIVASVHQKAMPVLLMTKDEDQARLTAPWSGADVLQPPLPNEDEKLDIVQEADKAVPA